MLRAATACTFSTSQLPKMVRCWCVFCILTCTFSTSQLPKVVRTCDVFGFLLTNVLRATTACTFSSLIWPAGSAPAALARLLFDPPDSGAPNHWKNTMNRDFPTFSRTCIFFLLTFSISYRLTSELLVADSSTSALPSLHIVGSLTSKLPSISSPIPLILNTPLRNHGLVGNFHINGTIFGGV